MPKHRRYPAPSAHAGPGRLTDDDSPVRIGVVGGTEAEARERFHEALTRWRAAYERSVDQQG
jgi:hypothetical protein